jgi:hypothetical protein
MDAVLFCTGFLYSFPFIRASSEVTVTVEEAKHVRPLHQQVVHVHDPTLAFIGLPTDVIPFLLCYYQVRYLLHAYRGLVALLPDESARAAALAACEQAPQEEDTRLVGDHSLRGEKQFDYLRRLLGSLALDGEDAAKERAHLAMVEAVYSDNSRHKPASIGAADSYRDRVYRVNRYVVARGEVL